MDSRPRSRRQNIHFGVASYAAAILRGPARGLLGPTLTGIAACIRSGATVGLRVGQDFQIEVPLSDAYWTAVGFDGSYEPEVLSFLDRLEVRPTLFVDCGANIGWWSLLAEKRWGWRCVAVEAADSLVQRIEASRVLNCARFEVVQKAVWSRDGERLTFRTGEAHAGGHLGEVEGFVADWRLQLLDEVDSVTIDSIVLGPNAQALAERIIVKIDVEGAEVEAIAGARRTIDLGALLIYEDHGADRSCKVTATLLDMGLDVYATDARLEKIVSLSDARAIKVSKRKGYNFFAVKPNTIAASDLESLRASYRT